MSRTLAIDYGARRIGLAVSDPMGIIAQPLTTLIHGPQKPWWPELEAVIVAQEVGAIVVGWPLNMQGQPSAQTEEVGQFVKQLEGRTVLPVTVYDERLTSVAAKRVLHEMGVKTGHNKAAVDRTAAAILLQDYLDSQS